MPGGPVLAAIALATAFAGAIGGIGGATVMVPLLVALGVDPVVAAPLGLASVAATSLAASGRQLGSGLVHQRLGLTLQVTASAGTIAGALLSTSVPEAWLGRALGLGALAGGVAMLARRGTRNLPVPAFADDLPGEWPGTLGGTYRSESGAVPYQATRVPQGLGLGLVAGAVSGLSGVGGGFLQMPAMSEVMRVPVKVAAATSTFTMGITAATGLIVFAGQGRIDVGRSCGVALGAIAGAVAGAAVQGRMPAGAARGTSGALLVAVAIVVLVRTL
jgi:hypothetical protein